MNDREFIEYCRSHCRTDVGMFFGSQVNRLLIMVGRADLARLGENQPIQLGPNSIDPWCDKAEGAINEVPS